MRTRPHSLGLLPCAFHMAAVRRNLTPVRGGSPSLLVSLGLRGDGFALLLSLTEREGRR